MSIGYQKRHNMNRAKSDELVDVDAERTNLRVTGVQLLTQAVNSKVKLAPKAQQQPQLPWSRISCMHLSLRKSTCMSTQWYDVSEQSIKATE